MQENCSLYDFSWKVSESEYREDSAISYSTISKYVKGGFNDLHKLKDKIESPSLLFGSLVDILMTDKENFDNIFFLADFPDIGDTLYSISKRLYQQRGDKTSIDEFSDEFLSQIGLEEDYYANSKFDNLRVKKIRENCGKTFELLIQCGDKKLINYNQYMLANKTIDCLNNSFLTSSIFNLNPFNTDIEGFNQLKFKGEYRGIPIRCMFDRIIVDHKNKTIKPYDLKTSYKKEWDFPKSYLEWNYYIQSNLYTYILRFVLKDTIYRDYIIENFRFIVINALNLKPLVWEDEFCNTQTEFEYNGIKYLNWRDTVKELDFYIRVQPDYPIDINYNKPNFIHKQLIK